MQGYSQADLGRGPITHHVSLGALATYHVLEEVEPPLVLLAVALEPADLALHVLLHLLVLLGPLLQKRRLLHRLLVLSLLDGRLRLYKSDGLLKVRQGLGRFVWEGTDWHG